MSEGTKGGTMVKTLTSGVIGFLAGAVLAFQVLVAAFALFGDSGSDLVQYAPLLFGLPVGLLGGVIGAAIGVVVGGRLED
jgi:hypothetical protein